MKLFKFLPLLLLFACSPEEVKLEPKNCNCERTFYIYYPPMGDPRTVFVPAKYTQVGFQTGVCGVTTNGIVPENGVNYSHQKTVCK